MWQDRWLQAQVSGLLSSLLFSEWWKSQFQPPGRYFPVNWWWLQAPLVGWHDGFQGGCLMDRRASSLLGHPFLADPKWYIDWRAWSSIQQWVCCVGCSAVNPICRLAGSLPRCWLPPLSNVCAPVQGAMWWWIMAALGLDMGRIWPSVVFVLTDKNKVEPCNLSPGIKSWPFESALGSLSQHTGLVWAGTYWNICWKQQGKSVCNLSCNKCLGIYSGVVLRSPGRSKGPPCGPSCRRTLQRGCVSPQWRVAWASHSSLTSHSQKLLLEYKLYGHFMSL